MFVAILILIFRGFAFAAEPLPPYAGEVAVPASFHQTSDYGPRNPSRGSFFHRGIDYSVDRPRLSDPISCLKEGRIIDIHRSNDNTVVFRVLTRKPSSDNVITDSSYCLRYLHMFDNRDLPIGLNGFILQRLTDGDNRLVIVRLAQTPNGYDFTRAQYILGAHEYEDQIVQIPGTTPPQYYKNADDDELARTTALLDAGDIIGPEGCSGVGTSIHLHVDWSKQDAVINWGLASEGDVIGSFQKGFAWWFAGARKQNPVLRDYDASGNVIAEINLADGGCAVRNKKLAEQNGYQPAAVGEKAGAGLKGLILWT